MRYIIIRSFANGVIFACVYGFRPTPLDARIEETSGNEHSQATAAMHTGEFPELGGMDMMTRTSTGSWIVTPRPNPRARLRLFCFPYGGAGASIFRTWSDGLLQDVELCAVQLPGRENRLRETPFTEVPALVETLAEVLPPLFTVPFAFFGHSLGAFVGFELACKLRNQNTQGPVHLFVSGQRAPQRPDPLPPIYLLDDDRFLEEICRRYDAIPLSVLHSEEMMRIVLPILRADYTMNDTYTCMNKRPLDCPITCFGGEQDAETTKEYLAAWADQTHGSFMLKMFAGGHFFIQRERESFLRALSEDLRVHVNACA